MLTAAIPQIQPQTERFCVVDPASEEASHTKLMLVEVQGDRNVRIIDEDDHESISLLAGQGVILRRAQLTVNEDDLFVPFKQS